MLLKSWINPALRLPKNVKLSTRFQGYLSKIERNVKMIFNLTPTHSVFDIECNGFFGQFNSF